ncbi:hypothetical protein I302_100850 [Kwoniella bestiolae CBS 10118]|uniref:Uncharacterized protein n=1 Tax=Kwoniella bestiolae CBS 10118 TaxID=1296100 RepID=A0A1B9G668_9TREE|nr:hypothetical protein I302_04223 [Kwoniella bestiolae CBS 10118]OCF26537.1 hypothetical protein I302_04223 [Kwoniella bestiolae CBS 10118]
MTIEIPLPPSTVLNPATKRTHPSSSSEDPQKSITSKQTAMKAPTNPDQHHPQKKPQRTISKFKSSTTSSTTPQQIHDGKTRRPSTTKVYSIEELNRCLQKAQDRLTLTWAQNQKESRNLRLAEENDSIRIEYIREKICNHKLKKEKEGFGEG